MTLTQMCAIEVIMFVNYKLWFIPHTHVDNSV